MRYETGDHLAVYPVNSTELVNKIGEKCGVDLDTVFTLTNTDGKCGNCWPFDSSRLCTNTRRFVCYRGVHQEASVPLSVLLQNRPDPLHRHHQQSAHAYPQGIGGVLRRAGGQGEIEINGVDQRRGEGSVPAMGGPREQEHRAHFGGHSKHKAGFGSLVRNSTTITVPLLFHLVVAQGLLGVSVLIATAGRNLHSSRRVHENCSISAASIDDPHYRRRGGIQDSDGQDQQGRDYQLVKGEASVRSTLLRSNFRAQIAVPFAEPNGHADCHGRPWHRYSAVQRVHTRTRSCEERR